jgi:hypothetical protein
MYTSSHDSGMATGKHRVKISPALLALISEKINNAFQLLEINQSYGLIFFWVYTTRTTDGT